MDRRERARALLRLGRPAETGVVFAGSLIGARLAELPGLAPETVIPVAASNAMLFAASVTFNDWHDREEDAINKPNRVVVSGVVSPRHALLASLALFALGVGLACVGGARFGAVAPLIVVLSMAYTLWLKGIPYLGNLLVALLSTYALACWILLAPPSPTYIAIALACVVFRLGGEIVKTSEDEAGDRAAGIRTVASTRGITFANRSGLACVSLALLVAATPVLQRDTNLIYHLTFSASIALAAFAWFFTSAVSAGTRSSGARLVKIERAVTVLMIIGLGFGLSPSPG